MKRWKKALSGLLMAALMVTGISFPENVFAVSAGMDGLPSVVNSGIGKMVDKSSTIDGTYNFTPVIGANTKIRFGCSDGSGSWDNKFCLNAEQHAHACSQWWPLSNINDGGNTRSFIPYERLKGKMYAEYTNVGNANGLPVTMRIWFLDWQNTDISGYPGYEDVDNVVVSVDNTKGGATPVIDIKGLKWIKVRFSYYDENGNPLKVKGHFTLSDLDYSQGFYIDGKVDGIYVTKEADDRLIYDARTDAIWSAKKGSNADDGTSPDNPEGWVTYTYEGDSQTMVFYNGGTIQNVDGPGKGLTTVQSYPKDFTFTGKDAIFNGWKGSSRTEATDWHVWNTSEFGYGTVMEGVTFHIWNDDKSYDKTQKTDNNGRITIDGVKDGTWHYQETATKDGYVLDNAVKDFTVSSGKVNGQSNLTITVENDYTKLDLAKVDSGTGENISGAKLSLLDSNGRLVESWTSGSTPHRIEKLKPGQYTLREDQAPDHYKLADPITFTLESKADTQTITMKDMRYADLTIVKKIKASDITWAHGNPTFIFTVKGKDINGKDRTFQNYVEFTENYVNSHTDGQGYVELSVTWNKIPVGEDYTVTEQDVLRYHLVNVTGTENVTISKLQEPTKGVAPDKIFSVHANLKAKPTGTSITFENQKDDWGTTTHDTSVKNIIPLK